MKVGLNERNDVDNKQPSLENFSLKVSLGKMFSKVLVLLLDVSICSLLFIVKVI